MRQRPTEERERQAERALQRDPSRQARAPGAHDRFDQRAENNEDRKAHREGRKERTAAEPRRSRDPYHRTGDDSESQSLHHAQKNAPLPREREAEWRDE